MEDPFKYFVWLCLLQRLMFDGLKSQFFIWKKKKEITSSNRGMFSLYGTKQYCNIQYSTVQYCTVLYYVVQYSTVQYSKVQYSTVL